MTFTAERPGCRRQGAAAGAARADDQARCCDRPRPRRLHRAATRLPRPKVHRKLMPGKPQARGVFEAVEQARVEAIGAWRMRALRRISTRCSTIISTRQVRRDHRPRRRAAVGCAGDARARTPDRPARRPRPRARWSISGVRRWRTRAARGSISSSRVTEDQAKFGDVVHELLSALDLGDDRNAEADEEENQDENATARTTSPAPKVARRRRAQERAPKAKASDRRDGGKRDGKRAGLELATFRRRRTGDDETPGEARGRNSHGANEPRGPEYKVFPPKFDEVDRGRGAVRSRRTGAAAQLLDKQLAHLQGVVARLANRLQRRLMAQQNRSWEFDLEEGVLDTARLTRVVTDPISR